MTELKIRRIPFSFEGVAFLWNPQNPAFSVAMNKLSFFAIGFEKYICQAMQDAEQLISDPAVLAEARAFRAQEGIHANAHKRHVKALIKQYPGLQVALDKTIESYDNLYAAKPLEYHLAYIGGLESIFTPSFKLLLDHRHLLFKDGDARVASLLLWHFCEEIEHRSSGLEVYNHVVGKYLFRVGNFKKFMGHVREVTDMLGEEFQKHVPGLTDDLFDPKSTSSIKLPAMAKLRSTYGILMSQMPWHNPDHQALPDYFQIWSEQYDRGDDMTQTYGVRWEEQLAAAE
ncbi:MAG: metal-dependent hydrolase [Rhizobiaceae bacterium]|nr:MAG: metal-dependent hydrolase [Rhizobiaceae bacterium]